MQENTFETNGIEDIKNIKLGKYFTLEELIESQTAKDRGIKNVPDQVSMVNLSFLVKDILDPLREAYGKPIYVTSGYRCPRLNMLVGGVPNSQHTKGQAVDIISGDGIEGNKKLFEILKGMLFDQLIWESGGLWIHVSYVHAKRRSRREILYK